MESTFYWWDVEEQRLFRINFAFYVISPAALHTINVLSIFDAMDALFYHCKCWWTSQALLFMHENDEEKDEGKDEEKKKQKKCIDIHIIIHPNLYRTK